MEINIEYTKLEKIELSGIKGKRLSQLVVNVFEEFQVVYKVFSEATYDFLEPEDQVRIRQHEKTSG